jgi:hypothetical protein
MSNEPSPLDFLRAVYLNEGLPLSVRMRAAMEAAPYIHPKLSAVAMVGGADFGERLDRAIQLSREGPQKLIELEANGHRPEGSDEP